MIFLSKFIQSFKQFSKNIVGAALILMTLLFSNHAFANKAAIERGQKIAAAKNCASCHGADFWSAQSPSYPRLAGQKQDYLYYALLSYKIKNNPDFGRNNAIMQGQVASLSQQELKDLAAYLSSLKGFK